MNLGWPMTRILVADDHAVVRRGLRALLEARAGWSVVAEAGNGEEVLDVARAARPNVTILDYSMPGVEGGETIRRLRREVPETEVLVFTLHETRPVIREILAAGARGFVPKAEADGQLLAAVEALSRRQPFFVGIAAEVLLGTYLETGDGATPLSPREREVVRLVARSSSNKQIAHALGISIKTVETHRTAAMRKVGVASTAALVRYAVQNGLE
jgi:DNA-binding NarL/FixJ family response regulator